MKSVLNMKKGSHTMIVKNYYCPTCRKFLTGFSVNCYQEEDRGCWVECKKCNNIALYTKDLVQEYIKNLTDKETIK